VHSKVSYIQLYSKLRQNWYYLLVLVQIKARTGIGRKGTGISSKYGRTGIILEVWY